MSEQTHDNDEIQVDKPSPEEPGRAENYVTRNRKMLSIIGGALIVLVGGYIGFKQLIVAPQEEEAQAALYIVQQQFAQDSFSLVVNGNGNDLSALDIIDEYGFTKAANIASFMAGVSYLHLGEFENAIDYLKDFSSKDGIVGPLAIGLIGDAYVEMDDLESGLSYYTKAVKKGDNDLVAPYFLRKIALVQTAMGDHEAAEKTYTRLRDDYKEVPEAQDIEKYISRSAAGATSN